MNEQLRKQLNTYRRSLENKRMQVSIYSVLLIIILLGYGLAGTYLLYKVTRKRIQTISEISRLVTDLHIKKYDMEEMKQKLSRSKSYIEKVNTAIPKEVMMEDFMVDLVNVAARNGFKQNRMNRRSAEGNRLELNVTFQGSDAQVHSLIDSIESLDRLTAVENLNLRTIEETATVSLVLSIYYLEK